MEYVYMLNIIAEACLKLYGILYIPVCGKNVIQVNNDETFWRDGAWTRE